MSRAPWSKPRAHTPPRPTPLPRPPRSPASSIAEKDSALAEKDEQLARAVAQKDSALGTQEAQVARAAEETAAQTAQGPPKSGGWWSVISRIKKVVPDTTSTRR